MAAASAEWRRKGAQGRGTMLGRRLVQEDGKRRKGSGCLWERKRGSSSPSLFLSCLMLVLRVRCLGQRLQTPAAIEGRLSILSPHVPLENYTRVHARSLTHTAITQTSGVTSQAPADCKFCLEKKSSRSHMHTHTHTQAGTCMRVEK